MNLDTKNKLGYKKFSPFKNEPYIDIKGNSITTEDVEFPLILIPDNDKPLIAMPNNNYVFKNSSKIREIPLKQTGGNFMSNMAGESTVPVSPFIDLKPFINKYKKEGGVIDYMNSLPAELQGQFIQEFDSLDRDTQRDVVKMLKGGYQEGGQMGVAELEDKETLITPSGELSKIEGKTHAEGGEIVTLPNQTRIYSQYLKVPQEVTQRVLGKETKKKYSYAELSKKFPTKQYIDIIEDGDKYEVEGAKIKLANNLSKLDTIFYAQEQEKKSKEENKFKCGGIKKYQEAGTFEGGQFGGSGAGEEFNWIQHAYPYPVGTSIIKYLATDKNRPFDFSKQRETGFPDNPPDNPPSAGFQRIKDWSNQFPQIHTEPSPTVSTGVVLNLRNDTPIIPQESPIEVVQDRVNRPKPVRKSTPSKSKSTVVPDKGINPLVKFYPNIPETEQPTIEGELSTPTPYVPYNPQNPVSIEDTIEYAAQNVLESNDNKNYPGTSKESNFGISNKLAGTIADVGLALSDKLTVREPTLYNRQKTPIFTRYVDFDDKEAQKMYSLRTQQIQNSNMPEAVKQAQLAALNSDYQDYQAKIDFANLQRYEQKREADTNKLQQYRDRNIDIKVEDLDSYSRRKARVDELRDYWKSKRKEKVVNALRGYADYVEDVNLKNQLIPNYQVNPITGRINYKSTERPELDTNILSQYSQSKPKLDLGQGASGQVIGNLLVVTDKDGKVTVNKLSE